MVQKNSGELPLMAESGLSNSQNCIDLNDRFREKRTLRYRFRSSPWNSRFLPALTSAFRSKADIKLNLAIRSANGPKRTSGNACDGHISDQ